MAITPVNKSGLWQVYWAHSFRQTNLLLLCTQIRDSGTAVQLNTETQTWTGELQHEHQRRERECEGWPCPSHPSAPPSFSSISTLKPPACSFVPLVYRAVEALEAAKLRESGCQFPLLDRQIFNFSEGCFEEELCGVLLKGSPACSEQRLLSCNGYTCSARCTGLLHADKRFDSCCGESCIKSCLCCECTSVHNHYNFIKVGSRGNYSADAFNLISISVERAGRRFEKEIASKGSHCIRVIPMLTHRTSVLTMSSLVCLKCFIHKNGVS